MKVSKLWLQSWVPFSLSEQALAHQLTMAGLEVESVSPVAGAFTKVVVAQVLSTSRHPDADKLTLCEVQAGLEKPLHIVCGAANVRPGLKVALAMVGAALPGGLIIKESKLRGELSQGMLCSVSELGLADTSDGIMELEEDAPVGCDLREYLQLDDSVFDIDLTPNRADCFSLLGVAREVAVLNKLPLQEQTILPVEPQVNYEIAVNITAPSACPHYCVRTILGINPHARTPVKISERLRRGGIRTIHPVVDCLNYVMLELGQPLHAFDLSILQGGVEVRFARDGEVLTLLDGQTVTLQNQVLVIADSKKPLALAGIMGGSESAVSSETCDVLLESAFFNPIPIAGVARKYSLFSDAAQRFERGVDPTLQHKALERATALILSIAGGKAGPVVTKVTKEHLPQPVILTFNTEQVKKLTGVSIPLTEITSLLQGLGMSIKTLSESLLEVTVPPHRFDIQQDVDLVEEVIRLYGYDNLQVEPTIGALQPGKKNQLKCLESQLATWFSCKGYHEIISYSFVDADIQKAMYPDKESMQLVNPISSELSHMRVGIWPGLIASMMYNVYRQQNAIRLFETGPVFDVYDQKVQERACLAGLLAGETGSLSWNESTRCFDFYDAKGDLQALFSLLKLKAITFEKAEHTALHPGQSARIMKEGQPIGWLGVLHPRLSDELELQSDVVLFELDLSALTNQQVVRYKTVSKYPQIRRDLSLLVDKSVTAEALEKVVRAAVKEDWLQVFEVFDVYTGEGIPEGKQSIAITMVLQSNSKTLVEAEINSVMHAILNSLEDSFSVMLRDS